MININVTNGTLSEQEINYYINDVQQRYPDKVLTGIDLEVDGDYINCAYHFETQPFERIRRITGYLVGTLDRFNNAKRAEESQRVKHGV